MIEQVKHKGLALAVLATAQLMVVLDATIVNVALPSVSKTLGFHTEAELQWIVTAYALAFGGLLLLGGRLADLFGRRKLFLIGAVIFAVASLLAGLAQTPLHLILFRALQGSGAALLAPAALSLLVTIFQEGRERNKAMGIWGMMAAGGGALGLLLGGILTQYVQWRWVFFINLPIAAALLVAAFRYLPASLPSKREGVDIIGAATITGSLMSLVYALAQAAQVGWGASSTLIAFAASGILMAWFIYNEMHVQHPLVRLEIFRQRNVTGGSLVMLLVPAAMFGLFFYLSLFMQQILGYSPVRAGVATLPFTLTVMAVAGVLSKRAHTLNPRILLIAGPLLAAAGLLYFSRIPVNASYVLDILPGIIAMAAGMAMVFVTALTAATQGVSQKESGLVSGLLTTSQQIGGAIGLAVLTVVSTTVTKDQLAKVSSLSAEITNRALVQGFHRGFIAAVGFALAASLVAVFVFRSRR